MKLNGLLFVILCSLSLVANGSIVGKQIDYEQNGVKLSGYLAYDSKINGQRPGVLIVHEWWGHNDYARKRADMLAELGYVAFALDMYGKGKLAGHPKDAGKMAGSIRSNKQTLLNRFNAAKRVLQTQNVTDKQKIAAIGYCFGGAVVLDVMRAGEKLAGVVSFHGSLVTDTPAKKGISKTKTLVLNGEADPFIKPEHIIKFKQEMTSAGVDYQFINYAGAKHAFTNPGADEFGRKFNIPLAYHPQADNQSWLEMQNFFKEIFSDGQ